MELYCWLGEMHCYKGNILEKYLTNLKNYGFKGIIYRGDRDNFTDVVEECSRLGLEIHTWYPSLICVNKELSSIPKELFAVSKDGNSSLTNPPYVDYYKWLCPNREEVYNLIIRDLELQLKDKRVTGVQLDYIRYCDIFLPRGLWKKYEIVMDRVFDEYDFCYCPCCREKFKKSCGVDPVTLKSGTSLYNNWIEFRQESITNLVKRIRDFVRSKNRVISAAVFPGPSIAKKNVLQNWQEWDLDYYFPMNYSSFYLKDHNWVREILNEEALAVGGDKIVNGIYLNNMSDLEFENSLEQIENSGVRGISLFVPEDMNEKKWESLKKILGS